MADLRNFQDWYENYLNEGGAQRRRIRDAFIRQIIPPIAPASVNSGLSGPPSAVMIAMKVKTDSDVRKSKPRAKKPTTKKKSATKKKKKS